MHFWHFSGARTNLTRSGCADLSRLLSELGSLPKMALRLWCRGFLGLFVFVFFEAVFASFKWSSSHPPLFVLVFFLFCAHSSWDRGQHSPARVFLGSWPSTLLFWVLLQKHCFPPEKKGYSCSFLNVSLYFSLASFTSPFHSLSLSLSLSLVFCFLFLVFFLPCFFVFLFPSLFFAVLSCLVSLLLFHEKNNIKILHLKGSFINYFCFVGFPVLL